MSNLGHCNSFDERLGLMNASYKHIDVKSKHAMYPHNLSENQGLRLNPSICYNPSFMDAPHYINFVPH